MASSIRDPMAILAFLALIAQNSSSTLVTKFSRGTSETKGLYASTAVICTTEAFKLILSYALEVRSRRQVLHKKEDSPSSLAKHLRSPINEMLYTRREESLRMFFPALCYAIVNMCSYAGIKLLDLPTYIITWQLKILAAALFGLVLYQREVSARKWLALFILVSGVTLVQLQPTEGTPSPRATQDYILGILIVILGSLGSGLAGAFLENALKSKTSPSIYIRNMQICFPALLFTAASFYFAPKDLQLIKEKGFFAGFSPIVWCMIALHGLGGMLVSFLVKHVGALWKGFASSLAIVVTNLVSIYTMPGSVTSPFQVWIGSALVIGSTLLFANS